MKRRGFLALMGGAAVAGPGMAKEAAAKAAAELSLGGVSGVIGGFSGGAVPAAGGPIGESLLQRAATSMSMLRGLTRDQRAEMRRRFGDVHRLDPDLASYHSMSMSARIEMQRDRNLEVYLRNRRTWWQGVIERGVDEWTPDPLDSI